LDEYSFECRPEIAEEIRQMAEQGFVRAGEVLKTAMPLAGEGKIGNSWYAVH
jgi:DNA polymerase I-like protein with 3'-5' exonuclease and polymerase domains